MKSGTIKIICTLIALLFLNIEAAQAGFVYKFKVYIGREFSGRELFYTLGAIFIISSLTYIMYKPAFKDEKAKAGKGRLLQGFKKRKRERHM